MPLPFAPPQGTPVIPPPLPLALDSSNQADMPHAHHPVHDPSPGKILSDGRMLRGPSGVAGPGIYFCDTPGAARVNGTRIGVVLKVKVG